MTKRVSLTGPASIPAVVETFLGFTPADSLVVLGLGGGPSARVDIEPGLVWHSIEALVTAAHHWTGGIVVALYSTTVDIAEVDTALAYLLPGVTVQVIVTVDEHDVVTDDEGNRHRPERPEALPARTVRPSRESLVADAERVTTPSSAWALARQSFLDGDGAKAWVYLDRFHALAASTPKSEALGRFLTDAISPKSSLARTTLA